MNLLHPDFGTVLWLAIVAGVITWAVYQNIQEARRKQEVRNALLEMGLSGTKLPETFSLPKLHPKLAGGRLSTIYVGAYAGYLCVAGDVRIGQGKGSYSQTFVAVDRRTSSPYSPPSFLSSLSFEYHQHGTWVLGTIDHQTMGVDAIRGFLECFA